MKIKTKKVLEKRSLGKLVIWAESPVSGVLEEDKSSMVNKKTYYLVADRRTVRN